MDVIRHQAVGIDRDAVSLAVLGQFFQIDLVVSVFGKSLLSLVPPDDDVVENSGGKEPGLSGHRNCLTPRRPICQLIEV